MSRKPVDDFAHVSRQDFPIVLASMPPPLRQRRLALSVVVLLSVAVLMVAPFASIQAPRVDAFIPVLQSVICVADQVTAFFLFAQYQIQPQRALLVLATGYMCSGLFAFLQTFAFPGAYAPTGLIGDGTNSAAWLFVFWRTSLPAAVILYTLWKDEYDHGVSKDEASRASIAITIACVAALVAAMTWIVTAKVSYLPTLYQGTTEQNLFAKYINVVLLFVSVAALGFLFLHRRTILDLWLIVTLFAWCPDFAVASLFTFVRFSVGWYAGRTCVSMASCIVFMVMLFETAVLYSRLAAAIVLQRRERAHRLMSIDAATAAIAHEVKQPLIAIVLNGETASEMLKSDPPDIRGITDCIRSMIDSCQSADQIISGIRTLFKPSSLHRTKISVIDVTRQALSLLAHDLQAVGVSVTTKFQEDLPPVSADSTQLQQVILNLVKNAIEAMDPIEAGGRHLGLAAKRGVDSVVLLSVEDSGTGITAENKERIFDTFFTSKPSGMGLGLPICRAIIEAHGGSLRLVKTDGNGSIFEMSLPIATTGHLLTTNLTAGIRRSIL